MTPISLQPITDAQWAAFSGAERFPSGDRPLFGSSDEIIVIAARGRVELYLGAGPEVQAFSRVLPDNREMTARLMASTIVTLLNQGDDPAALVELVTELFALELE